MIAEAHIETDKASKYLKWLCGHFGIKAKAEYDDTHGTVQFEFGDCEMQAHTSTLIIRVSANAEEPFSRIKFVVADHLERFGRKDSIQVIWEDIKERQQ